MMDEEATNQNANETASQPTPQPEPKATPTPEAKPPEPKNYDPDQNERNARFLARNPDAWADFEAKLKQYRGDASEDRVKSLELKFERAEAGRKHGLSDDDMILLTGQDAETIHRQAELIAAKNAKLAAMNKPADPKPEPEAQAEPAPLPGYTPADPNDPRKWEKDLINASRTDSAWRSK